MREEFFDLFLVLIQLGAVLAVIILFFKSLKSKENIIKIVIGVLPCAILGLIFEDIIDKYFYNVYSIAICLIFYGIIFLFTNKFKTNKDEVSYKHALYIGLFQTLSLFPGSSRSGVTIIGGMMLGYSRVASSEFSFFLSIPTMLGASFLKSYNFFQTTSLSHEEFIVLLVGFLTALATSLLCIKGLMNYIKKNDFKIFGIYRIILGIILLSFFY